MVQLALGQLSPQKAFLTGKIKVKGNLVSRFDFLALFVSADIPFVLKMLGLRVNTCIPKEGRQGPSLTTLSRSQMNDLLSTEVAKLSKL